MIGWTKKVAPVAARMMTWEVTTSFDGTLTETELRKRFDENFRDVFVAESRVFFWSLVSFNASDGRKHRYLVTVADEPLEKYRKKFDCCLPKQIVFYAIADKILRGEWKGEDCLKCDETCVWVDCECAEFGNNCAENGNLLLVALCEHCLYILVFMEGRLCHWSEEYGYGETFGDACRERVARFKEFLKVDDLFAKMNDIGEFVVCCENVGTAEESPHMNERFQVAARDPFWCGKDLDACDSMKSCERRRWIMSAVALFVFCACVFAMCDGSLNLLYAKFFDDEKFNLFIDAAPVELSQPAARDLEMLAWAEGHRDLLPAKWTLGRTDFADGIVSGNRRISRSDCDSSEFSLLGIVGGRVALVKTSAGETKTLAVGDSLSRYRVKRIGMNDVVMRCGRKEVRYALKMR